MSLKWLRAIWGSVLVLVLVVQAGAGQWQDVTRVHDGDTLTVAGGQMVRLLGIDAPELGSEHSAHAQYYARQSRDVLRRLVEGHEVRIEGQGTDHYGRTLALVWRRDGVLINERLVAEGAAFVFPHGDENWSERWAPSQRAAMAQGRGFWPRILALPQARDTYVGTRSSRRFHVLSCPYARRIGRHNRVVFSSLQAAFSAGFAPCRVCTPWPQEKP